MRLKTMSEVLLENLDKQDIPDSIPTPGIIFCILKYSMQYRIVNIEEFIKC